jgi:hypothetical protein
MAEIGIFHYIIDILFDPFLLFIIRCKVIPVTITTDNRIVVVVTGMSPPTVIGIFPNSLMPFLTFLATATFLIGWAMTFGIAPGEESGLAAYHEKPAEALQDLPTMLSHLLIFGESVSESFPSYVASGP